MSEAVAPHSFGEAAAALAGATAQGRPVRFTGGSTKLGWGGSPPPRAIRLQTGHLDRVLVNDDLTATIDAGTPLVRAQSLLALKGLMLAIDPHLGLGQRPEATIGGVIATADTGPLSHRYGPASAQVVGITVALTDGTIVRTGPRAEQQKQEAQEKQQEQQKQEAWQDGYDLTRLLIGSFGTLGLILAADIRVRPLLSTTATAMCATEDPVRLRETAVTVAARHPELEALDLAWRAGRGGLLAQLSGDQPQTQAAAVAETMRSCGMDTPSVRTDDAGLWARQRGGQRSAERAVVRVHARSGQLDAVLNAADRAGAIVVGRAALGIAFLTVDVNRVAALRAALPSGTAAVALDLPIPARGAVDVWGASEGPELALMRGLKASFDPAAICNPGVFVGSI